MRTKFDYTVQTNTEEVLDKAGWMYADLFLALMVIFLATISFVPSLTKLPNTASGAVTSSVNINNLNFFFYTIFSKQFKKGLFVCMRHSKEDLILVEYELFMMLRLLK